MITLVYELSELIYKYRIINHEAPNRATVTQKQWDNFVKEYAEIGIIRNEKEILGLKVEIGNEIRVWKKV